jgi:hypothetical protein
MAAECVELFLLYSYNKYMRSSDNAKKGSKGSKTKSVGRTVTFVVPVEASLCGRQLLVDAAKLAGFLVKNIFTPEVTLVSHVYSQVPSGQLLFRASKDFFILSVVENVVEKKSFTFTLFGCELNLSTQTMERICPMASVRGGIGSALVSELCQKAAVDVVSFQVLLLFILT